MVTTDGIGKGPAAILVYKVGVNSLLWTVDEGKMILY